MKSEPFFLLSWLSQQEESRLNSEMHAKSMSKITIEQLRMLAEKFVAAEPARMGIEGFWQTPLLVSALIDERFDILPQITFNEHLHPRELLSTAKSVVVFFIPFKCELVKENKKGDRPCRNWGLAYVQTNDLINRLSQAIEEFRTNTSHPQLRGRYFNGLLVTQASGSFGEFGALGNASYADYTGRMYRSSGESDNRGRFGRSSVD